jgi:hypothetical protein
MGRATSTSPVAVSMATASGIVDLSTCVSVTQSTQSQNLGL